MLLQIKEKQVSYCYNRYPTVTALNQVEKFTTFQFKKKKYSQNI